MLRDMRAQSVLSGSRWVEATSRVSIRTYVLKQVTEYLLPSSRPHAVLAYRNLQVVFAYRDVQLVLAYRDVQCARARGCLTAD